MAIRRWDAVVVAAVAAASAAAFAGWSSRLAEAEGPGQVRQAKVARNGAAVPMFSGCQLSAKTEKPSFSTSEDAAVTITALNSGESSAVLSLTVSAETMEIPGSDGKAAVMSRRMPEFTYTKVAEQTVTLAVEPGKSESRTITFKLPAGNFIIRAVEGKKTAVLCSFGVAAPKVIAAAAKGQAG